MLLKIIGIAFATAIAALLLKQSKPEIALAVTIAGVIVVLVFVMDSMEIMVDQLREMAQGVGVNNQLIKIIFKVVGIGYITEFSADVLSDFGAQSIANKVVVCGKVAIVMISLPVFQTLLSLISGFLKLV